MQAAACPPEAPDHHAPGPLPCLGMTIRLSVDRTRWWAHVADVAEQIDGLVPVVKGNGYGFGRDGLAIAAVELSPLLAVGTVHELAGLPEQCTPIVLTPTLHPARVHRPGAHRRQPGPHRRARAAGAGG